MKFGPRGGAKFTSHQVITRLLEEESENLFNGKDKLTRVIWRWPKLYTQWDVL